MAATAPVDPLLTTIEVAALLRVHPKHVYRLLRRGLPGRRVGSEWRFARGEVMQWAARNGRVGADEHAAEEATAPAPGPAAPALVAANGDVVVEILLALAQERGEPLVGFVSADMKRALEMLGRRAVLAAGCHAGGFPTHLGGERLARIHLVTREVGLVHPSGTPPPTLRKLGRLRFASRPPSAGVRRHLDAALAAEGIDAATAHRSAVFLGSHADVVCAVASGHAAVGLASRAWGKRLGLAFRSLATEPYGLIVRARDLGDPRVVRLCEVAQSAAFRREAAAAGYDVAGSGDIRYDAAEKAPRR